jgi:Ca-activated chloride channel family protein
MLVFACSAPSQTPNARAPLGGNPLVPAIPPAETARPQGQVLAAADGPAHVFTPRSHPAHALAAPRFVDPARLPKMRMGGCFAPEPPMIARSARPKRLSKGGGYGRGRGSGASASMGSSAPSKAMPPAPPAAAPAPSARANAASEAGDGYGYEYKNDPLNAGAMAGPSRDDARKREAPAEAEVARDQVLRSRAAYHDYGASIYLSNDDTMSLSSAQRVLFAIDRFLPIPREHIRPHELLNYFSFETAPLQANNDFSVHAELEAKPGEPGVYTLGLSVAGRELSKAERRNAALTFVVDRSGSMSDEGRMDYLKRGLLRMTSELKRGDLINLVVFDHEACSALENFVVGRDSNHTLSSTIQKLAPRGSTDVDSGLRLGYSLADKSYQPTHSNRVVVITDALANTGVTDPEVISLISAHYDKRRIRLSGVGVGTEFNDGLLDRLTERGKGAYVFLGSPGEVDAVFGERFVSLIETTANDVHFKLSLPPSLRMNVFYGEESSTTKEDVQAVHYSAGTSQLFLSDLASATPELRRQDSVMLSVEYEDPETGARQFEDFAFNLGRIAERTDNVRKARLVMSFIDGLADTVSSTPERYEPRFGGWRDQAVSTQCARGQASLAEQSQRLPRDAEVERVVSLWDKYCSRYEAMRAPVRRTPPQGADVWPSAQR